MIDSTLELITQAASNSLFIFCFCNLIIVMIIVGSKPDSSLNPESQILLSMITNSYTDVKHDKTVKHSLDGNKENTLAEVCEQSTAEEVYVHDGGDEEVDNDDDDDDEEEEDNDDDELRRRVEEFIDKVNRGWKAELMRTSHLV